MMRALAVAAAGLLAACQLQQRAPTGGGGAAPPFGMGSAGAFTEAHATALADSIEAALADFARLSAAGQLDSAATRYSANPRFRFLESGLVKYRSAAEVREALTAMPAGTPVRTTFSELVVDPIRPGVGTSSALFRTEIGDPAAGGFAYNGAITMVWVHEPEGWRIRSGHSSAPVARDGGSR